VAEHKTLEGNAVDHKHFEKDLTPADMKIAETLLEADFNQAKPLKPPTRAYNCHGFAYAPEHPGWFNVPDLFLRDHYSSQPCESAQPGDVIIYINGGLIAHSAVVIKAEGGKIKMVQSKWGAIAEVKHPPEHVPSVYGQPLVLLRPRNDLPPHRAVLEAEQETALATSARGGAGEAADTAGAEAESTAKKDDTDEKFATAETTGQAVDLPESFMLMLASTPEVERRIRQSAVSAQASSSQPLDAPPVAETLEFATDAASTESGEVTAPENAPSDIQEALERLPSDVTQFALMLASSLEMLRLVISQLLPVKNLIEIGQTKPQETRSAVLEFFERPETQEDEQIIGIALYLLSQLPSKGAVAAITRYLQAGTFSSFNGGLAVDALRASIAEITA